MTKYNKAFYCLQTFFIVKINRQFGLFFRERDSSGTTVGADLCVCPEGDGADSPTRGQPKADRSGSPNVINVLIG